MAMQRPVISQDKQSKWYYTIKCKNFNIKVIETLAYGNVWFLIETFAYCNAGFLFNNCVRDYP